MSGLPGAIGAETGTVPAIDLAAGLERVMGDRDLFLRVLGRFAGDYRDLAARLHAALDAGDTTLAQRIAHTLKGAAGMIEAEHVCQLALEVELGLKAGAVPAPLIAALDAGLARVLADIDALLVPAPAAAPMAPDAAAPETHDLARLRDMLDVGDGRAPDLVCQLRPRLLAAMGSERMTALESAVMRFDYERALALLDQDDGAPARACGT